MAPVTTQNNECNSRIKKLPPLLINQLAAGEIVTRPASVVKELLENAIDAGATQIEIKVTQGGMGMIEVSDNGCGIHPDDMVMAVTRHATSKIADVANLQGIRTLGFRGEALASTAAVSRLTLSSSHDDSGIGRQLSIAGILEESPILTPIVHSQGTTVLVKDLYFNVPARRGNLKSVATEFAHIESVVREVALAYADVSLTLFHERKKRLVLLASESQSDREVLNADPLGDSDKVGRLPLSRLEQALGMSLTTQSVPLIVDLAGLLDSQFEGTSAPVTVDDSPAYGSESQILDNPQIEGWLWTMSQYDAPQSLPKLLYVNGRLIKDQVIASQLRQTIQSAATAVCGYALYFQLPTHWLNVNVHPNKQRIKIHALANIMAHLDYAIKAKLGVFTTERAQENTSVSYSDNPSSLSPRRQVSEHTHSYRTKAGQNKSESSSNAHQLDSRSHGITGGAGTSYKDNAFFNEDASSKDANNEEAGNLNDLIESYGQDHFVSMSEEELNQAQSQPPFTTAQAPHDLPMLLKVFTELSAIHGLIERSANDNYANYKASLPLLLIYWQEQHFLISYQSWFGLWQERPDTKGLKIENREDALTIKAQYAKFMMTIPDNAAAKMRLKDHLREQSVAMLGVEQLLSIMLTTIKEHGGAQKGNDDE